MESKELLLLEEHQEKAVRWTGQNPRKNNKKKVDLNLKVNYDHFQAEKRV